MSQIEYDLKDIVLNQTVPHVIKNLKIPWPCLNLSLEQWCNQFDSSQAGAGENQPVPTSNVDVIFETGSRKFSNYPQWEKFRNKRKMTVNDFFRDSSEENEFFKNNWAAYSYKNIKEVPAKCTEGVDFQFFGFPEVKDDITFWLSSMEAHTPCHYDTYGCNIVVQVYGRKLWALFPPNAKLTPIRIPYEESSVYCSETFYSPNNLNSYKDIEQDCYSCILEPGDVLIVPPKWWHYVENLCPSLSINAWIPLVWKQEIDVDAQIEECIVRILVRNFIKSNGNDEFLDFLNPNETDAIVDESDLFQVLQHLIDLKMNPISIRGHECNYLSADEYLTIMNKYKEKIVAVPKLSSTEFHAFLKERFSRYDASMTNELKTNYQIHYQLINSVCNPTIISNIKEKFLSNFKKQNE